MAMKQEWNDPTGKYEEFEGLATTFADVAITHGIKIEDTGKENNGIRYNGDNFSSDQLEEGVVLKVEITRQEDLDLGK